MYGYKSKSSFLIVLVRSLCTCMLGCVGLLLLLSDKSSRQCCKQSTLRHLNDNQLTGTLDAIDFENINSLCVALGGGRRKGLVSGEREREGRLTSHGTGHAGASLRKSLVILCCDHAHFPCSGALIIISLLGVCKPLASCQSTPLCKLGAGKAVVKGVAPHM